MEYGYVRVSTREQNEIRQLEALWEFGIRSRNLFIDKQSGKDFERPSWRRLMRKLREGDLVVVKSIDRLGRNYQDILEQWRLITRDKGADIVILDMPLLDTRAEDNGLTRAFISDLVLQILSYVAQTERENIRQRQAEGIAAAKARGVRFGPKPGIPPPTFPAAYEAYKKGDLSVRAAAKVAKMTASAFYRQCQREKEFQADEDLSEMEVLDVGEEISEMEVLDVGEEISEMEVLDVGEKISEMEVLDVGEKISEMEVLDVREEIED